MDRKEFMEFISNTSFDENLKQLFLTAYDMGFADGKLDQMRRVNDVLDSIEFEMEKK